MTGGGAQGDIVNNSRTSGERAYKGEIVAKALWPGIISKREGGGSLCS